MEEETPVHALPPPISDPAPPQQLQPEAVPDSHAHFKAMAAYPSDVPLTTKGLLISSGEEVVQKDLARPKQPVYAQPVWRNGRGALTGSGQQTYFEQWLPTWRCAQIDSLAPETLSRPHPLKDA